LDFDDLRCGPAIFLSAEDEETPMTKPFFEDADFRDRVLAKIKLGRLGRVEDVTGAVVYLASDASGLVTGSSVVIDGGWTAD
jgi:NAD(P)-dependent dehydrogenase (short-subunit alcohol dehydrogenase family)